MRHWAISYRSVDIWWEPRLHRRLYERSFGYHHIYLPPGIAIRWGRSTRAMLKEQGVDDPGAWLEANRDRP